MNAPERVVFDSNVFFQALISPGGPAGECLNIAKKGELHLFISHYVLNELRDVCLRPHLSTRFNLSEKRIDGFIDQVKKMGTLLEDVPHVFDYERDPDDEPYIDLAVASMAKLIVSRDKDLLMLANRRSQEGKSFHERFSDLMILKPEELLKQMRSG